jgi:hypothetical protein
MREHEAFSGMVPVTPGVLGGVSAVLALTFLACAVWSPGLDVRDGRHDRGQNGIWLLPRVNDEQTGRFLDAFADFRVMPWIGGALGEQAFPISPEWRANFAARAAALLIAHPRLAGVHAGLARFDALPAHCRGVALYSEWETDDAERALWRERFRARPAAP